MFQINCISHGWFEFSLGDGKNTFEYSCSNIGEYDIIRELLSSLNNMIYKGQNKAYFFLNHESGASLMTFEKKGDSIRIEVKEIIESNKHFLNVHEPASFDFKCRNTLFDYNTEFILLTSGIWKEFKKIDRTGYFINWGEFPQEEFESLDKYIKYRI